MHWAHFLLQMMPSCLGRMALLLSVALLTVVRTYARNFKSEEEKEDDESDGTSFVPGGKKYKEMVSGSKNINSPIPINVKEFENIPVDNDVHQDLSKRNGGNSTNSHV